MGKKDRSYTKKFKKKQKKSRSQKKDVQPGNQSSSSSDFQESSSEEKHFLHFRELSTWFNRYRFLLEIAGLLMVIAVGLLVRMEDLHDWKAHPQKALYHGEPLLTTFDGYFYLTLARDLAEGDYAPVDDKRAVPDYPMRPSPPPLLSVVAAVIHNVTSFSMNWIGAVLPAALGILLAIPLYGLGRFYGGPVMGLTAALMGLLSHYYVYRSSLGWFDTDCMNVTWATGAAWCFLKFGMDQTSRRYYFLLAGLVIYGLFLWWWDQTPQVTTVVALLPLVVALVFFYRPSKKEGMIFAGMACVAVLIVLAWKGTDLPARVFHDVVSRFHYISKEAAGDFPNMGLTISEQARPSFREIVAKTTDSLPAFIFAGIGLLMLFYRKPKESLFLSVPLILACLSFLFAKRFLIFLAPVSALGIGFLISELWRWRKFPFTPVFSVVLVAVLAWPAFSKDMAKTFWPKEPPHLVEGMVKAGGKTPENAVIWAWWDHGYPMIYWSRRGTINDGSVHNPERSVYNGIPLAVHNYRLSANFMQFYAGRGLSGIHKFYQSVDGDRGKGLDLIKRVMTAGPERAREVIQHAGLKPVEGWRTVDDWLRFFFPADTRPVYLFLDWRLTITSYWWFWLGTWDIEKHDGIHPVYKAYYGLRPKGPGVYSSRSATVNLKEGSLKVGNRQASVRQIIYNDGKRIRTLKFNRDDGYSFELFAPGRFGALEDQYIARSVFNTLFLRHTMPSKYFQPVMLKTPSFQIWKVEGDKLDRS